MTNYIPFIETFETSPGTDITWVSVQGVDFDATIPSGVTGWGTECAKFLSTSDYSYGACLFPDTNLIYAKVEFLFEEFVNPSQKDIFIGISPPGDVGSCLNIAIDYSGGDYIMGFTGTGISYFSTEIFPGQKYIIEFYGNADTGDYEFKLDGVSKTSGSSYSGGTFGAFWVYADIDLILYLDNIEIDTDQSNYGDFFLLF